MEFIKAQKKYGQNFLKNDQILSKIATSVPVNEKDLIIEIGPGTGALTKKLVKNGSYLLCYEIDERMKPYLDVYESEKAKVLYMDFLESNLKEDIRSIPYTNLYVIANIPYYITTQILTKLINEKVVIQKMILLVQKEFGLRICAESNHKEYNAFTLYVDAFYDAKILFEVDKTNFVPSPKVDSVVIELSLKESNSIEDMSFYLQFVRDAFHNKRKTLKNNMKNYDFEKIGKILAEMGYKEQVRAEEISKEDFKKLANKYHR